MRLDADRGVHGQEPARAASSFGRPCVRGHVEDLALQVGDVDLVEVDEAERADAGRRQVHRDG